VKPVNHSPNSNCFWRRDHLVAALLFLAYARVESGVPMSKKKHSWKIVQNQVERERLRGLLEWTYTIRGESKSLPKMARHMVKAAKAAAREAAITVKARRRYRSARIQYKRRRDDVSSD
jgi:hypothetical protein